MNTAFYVKIKSPLILNEPEPVHIKEPLFVTFSLDNAELAVVNVRAPSGRINKCHKVVTTGELQLYACAKVASEPFIGNVEPHQECVEFQSPINFV